EQALAKTRPQHNNNRKPHPKIVDKVSVAPQNRYRMTARAESPQARAARLLRRETDLYCLDRLRGPRPTVPPLVRAYAFDRREEVRFYRLRLATSCFVVRQQQLRVFHHALQIRP